MPLTALAHQSPLPPPGTAELEGILLAPHPDVISINNPQTPGTLWSTVCEREQDQDREVTPGSEGRKGPWCWGQCRPRRGSCGSRRVSADHSPGTWQARTRQSSLAPGLPWKQHKGGGSLAARYPMWFILCAVSSSVPTGQALSLSKMSKHHLERSLPAGNLIQKKGGVSNPGEKDELHNM